MSRVSAAYYPALECTILTDFDSSEKAKSSLVEGNTSQYQHWGPTTENKRNCFRKRPQNVTRLSAKHKSNKMVQRLHIDLSDWQNLSYWIRLCVPFARFSISDVCSQTTTPSCNTSVFPKQEKYRGKHLAKGQKQENPFSLLFAELQIYVTLQFLCKLCSMGTEHLLAP